MTTLALIALMCAAVPGLLFLRNVFIYRTPARVAPGTTLPSVSVLIPARNEERNIAAALQSVVANSGIDFEAIVIDDSSTDRTPEIVREISELDGRVRLAVASPLPPGWCGKQHACHQLAGLARNPVMVFMDADVRLSKDALRRMVGFLQSGKAKLVSGVPLQETETFLEKLLIPLIHFVLLSFLPVDRMRRTTAESYAAGCGQLFIADREAYFQSGGHSKLASSFHDGLRLPRAFREAGFLTDLFDATQLAHCRMYRNGSEVWSGLSKNATEGLGSPGLIMPMTFLLLSGQVLPFLLLPAAVSLGGEVGWWLVWAALFAILPRIIAAARFSQSWFGAILHPFGIVVLLTIQWCAFLRKLRGTREAWKGRTLTPSISGKI